MNELPASDDVLQRVADSTPRDTAGRARWDSMFQRACALIASVSVIVLGFLLFSIVWQGVIGPPVMKMVLGESSDQVPNEGNSYLTTKLVTNSPEPEPSSAGMRPALFGTLWVCGLCALFTLPIGVATAILLEEFKPRHKWAQQIHSLIQVNITNLAGVPSVVYGILGMTAFVSMFGLFNLRADGVAPIEFGVRHYYQFLTETGRVVLVPASADGPESMQATTAMQGLDFDMNPVSINVIDFSDPVPEDPAIREYTIYKGDEATRISIPAWYYFRLPLGRGVLTGALTLMLVVLPIVIISSQESLRSVPSSMREGAFGLGATPWQVVWNITLPSAVPGIMTGSILAMSRAIGEAAPILIIAGTVYITHSPHNLMDSFTVMPLQIFNWTGRPQEDFHGVAAAGIIVLLGVLLTFNAIAVYIRHHTHNRLG